MKKSILITGGTGYLGARIALKLSEIIDFDISITTHKKKIKDSNWFRKGSIIYVDLAEEEDLRKICQGSEVIIHLAALNEAECSTNPKLAYIVNTLGTKKLVETAEKEGVKRLIYFSTAHVYKSPLIGAINEKIIPNPSSIYAKTHKDAEDFVLKPNKDSNTCNIVLRVSNAFGAPVHPNISRWSLVVNDFCLQAIVNKKIILKSSGLEVRDFITIQDVTNAVLHFINLSALKCFDGVFNLGGENTMSIISMAELVVEQCNKLFNFKPDIIVSDKYSKKIEENQNLVLDFKIDKLKSTGFKLSGNIQEEIQNTLKFCNIHFGKKSIINT